MASTSHSTALAVPASELTIPKYSNWLAVGHALVNVLCKGLRPYVTREMGCLYKCINTELRISPMRDPANVKKELMKWRNVHGDVNFSLFTVESNHTELSPSSIINGADDMDITDILNLMYWCKKFKILQTRVKEIR